MGFSAKSVNGNRNRWEPEVFLRLPYTGVPPLRATLRGLYKQTLQVVIDRAVTQFEQLKVLFGEVEIAGTVQYCRPWHEAFLVSISVESPPDSRRREPRLPVNCPCSVTAIADGCSQQCEGVIADISASGIGVRVDQPLETGTMVCVQAEDFVAAGQLLCSRSIGRGQFSCGIALTDLVWGEKKTGSWSAAKKLLRHAWGH